jgi:hypothetical protein
MAKSSKKTRLAERGLTGAPGEKISTLLQEDITVLGEMDGMIHYTVVTRRRGGGKGGGTIVFCQKCTMDRKTGTTLCKLIPCPRVVGDTGTVLV